MKFRSRLDMKEAVMTDPQNYENFEKTMKTSNMCAVAKPSVAARYGFLESALLCSLAC